MGGERQWQACKECSERCKEVHGERERPHTCSPTPLSFFKVMIGDFREAMSIPPKFARNFRDLVNQYVRLRDSNEHDWAVKLSLLDGSLVFNEGWLDFVLGQNIQVGEFVVFTNISGTLFSAEIYATSACKRVYVNEKQERSSHERKRNENEFCPKSSHLDKEHGIFKESEAHCGHARDPPKNGAQVKAEPCDSSSMEILEAKRVSKAVARGKDTAEKASHHKLPADIPCKDHKQEHEADMAIPTKACYTMKAVINEETDKMDCSRPKIDKNDPMRKRQRHRTNNDPMRKRRRRRTKKMCLSCCETPNNQQESEVVDKNFLRSHDSSEKSSEVNGENIVIRRFLISEEGICYIVDENLTDELGASRVTPIDFCDGGKNDTMCQVKEVAISRTTDSRPQDNAEVPCTKPVTDCSEDNENPMASKVYQMERRSGPLGNASDHVFIEEEAPWIGDAAQSMTDMPECHNDPSIMGEKPLQSVPDTIPKYDEEKKAFPRSSVKDFEVKCERMDSTYLPSLNSVNFSFSVSVKAQSWLELPQHLPLCLGKKKGERKIVMLRDLSMRLWPVMYLQSISFVGFLGGWEDFARANMVQQGDSCRFEEVNRSEAWELTLQVSILKV